MATKAISPTLEIHFVKYALSKNILVLANVRDAVNDFIEQSECFQQTPQTLKLIERMEEIASDQSLKDFAKISISKEVDAGVVKQAQHRVCGITGQYKNMLHDLVTNHIRSSYVHRRGGLTIHHNCKRDDVLRDLRNKIQHIEASDNPTYRCRGQPNFFDVISK